MVGEIPPGLIIFEPTSKGTATILKVKKILVTTKTKYQDVVIADLEDYGRALILDNYVQSSEADEYIYHEVLVHPALVTHPNPRKVLIIGGGEGATLREVLKHNTVEEAVMVDIDGEVVEFAKKYLEYMHKGSFSNPKAKIVIMDGKEYVKKTPDKTFDVVIMDLTDPYSSEIAKELYSKEFFGEINRILSEDGIVVTQAGNAFFYWDVYKWVRDNIASNFPIVVEYEEWVPVFGYACNFIIGSKVHDPTKLSSEEVEKRLRERNVETVFYNGKAHVGIMYKPITLPIRLKKIH
ncbi:polyamine aminopropyltransferase [Desulfurococcaceae archaeon MEX13E-LK6-19]|nr:polyamine aminopropyltransferase [Desulfurococcaceae archaeon MEX13E-LK6-19]